MRRLARSAVFKTTKVWLNFVALEYRVGAPYSDDVLPVLYRTLSTSTEVLTGACLSDWQRSLQPSSTVSRYLNLNITVFE